MVEIPWFRVKKQHRSNSYLYNSAKNGLTALSGLSICSFLLNPNHLQLGEQAIAASTLICQFPLALWLRKSSRPSRTTWWVLPLGTGILCFVAFFVQLSALVAFTSAIFSLWILPRDRQPLVGHHEKWWEPFLNHPARVLISTFFGLCLLGTVLLLV